MTLIFCCFAINDKWIINCDYYCSELEHKSLMVPRIPRNASSGTLRLLSTGSDDNDSSSDSSNGGSFFVQPRVKQSLVFFHSVFFYPLV